MYAPAGMECSGLDDRSIRGGCRILYERFGMVSLTKENHMRARELPPLDARIPFWDMDDLDGRGCPLCNNSDAATRYIRPDRLEVHFCEECSTYFVSPSPSERQLSSFYSTYDETHRRDYDIKAEDLSASYGAHDLFSDFRIRELSSIMQITDARVLDVGFGRGFLLYCLNKLGANTYGVDPDPKSIEYAHALGIQHVIRGTIHDLPHDVEFALIMMNDVIEHSLNPMQLIEKASRLLGPQGLLLISTPNGNATLSEEHPTTFRVDLEHMQYLTTRSCLYIACKLGLSIVHLETLGFPMLAGIDAPLSKQAPESGKVKSSIVKALRVIPGFSRINRIRKVALTATKKNTFHDERMGKYHLFCIFQKPACPRPL